MQGVQLFAETGRLLTQRYGAKANGLAAWAAAQLMHESADGTSNVAKSCNNYAGITFAGQKGATPCGNQQPGAEGGRNYAKFANYADFLADYVRILKMNRSGQGAPWNAKDLREFVTRLKLNGYFSDSIENYLAALTAKLKKYYQPAAAKAQKETMRQEPAARVRAREKQVQQQIDREVSTRRKSLTAWFEDLSALNKALVIGVSGFILTRLLDR